MDCRELMIGDWYQWYADGKYYQYQVKTEDFTKDHVANFEPIPLTPEILEKNGFILNEEDDWFEYENNHRYVIVLFCRELDTDEIVNDSFTIFNGCDCRYVHQLQHALRLCGLNELAENFKI